MERNPKNMTWLVETFLVQPWLWKRKLTRRFTKKLLTTLTATTARRFPHRWAEISRHDRFIKDSWIYFQSLIYGLRRVGLNPTEEEIRDMINQVAPFLIFIIMSSVEDQGHVLPILKLWKENTSLFLPWLIGCQHADADNQWIFPDRRHWQRNPRFSSFPPPDPTETVRGVNLLSLFIKVSKFPRWTTRRSTKMLSGFSAKTMKVFLFENLSPG